MNRGRMNNYAYYYVFVYKNKATQTEKQCLMYLYLLLKKLLLQHEQDEAQTKGRIKMPQSYSIQADN